MTGLSLALIGCQRAPVVGLQIGDQRQIKAADEIGRHNRAIVFQGKAFSNQSATRGPGHYGKKMEAFRLHYLRDDKFGFPAATLIRDELPDSFVKTTVEPNRL